MNNQIIYIFIFLVSVFISSISQVILKASANKTYKKISKEYVNPLVLGAYIIFGISTIITTISYKNVPLSLGQILESTGYIFVNILCYFFLHESIKKRKMIGMFFILLGIFIMFI